MRYPNNDLDIKVQFFKDAAKYPLFSPEEEREIFIKYNNEVDENIKKDLKNNIVLANIKLVVSIANSYNSFYVELMDLYSEGFLGLIDAIDRYDINSGNKFSTYATFWIKKYIRESIQLQTRMVRIPIKKLEKLSYISKKIEQYILEYRKEPSEFELFDYINEIYININDIKDYFTYKKLKVSLNDRIFSDEDEELLDRVIDKNANTEEVVLKKITEKEINYIFDNTNFKKTEKFVIKYRFGFNKSEYVLSLRGIGILLNRSRERIRIIEKKALTKLKKTLNTVNVNASYNDYNNEENEIFDIISSEELNYLMNIVNDNFNNDSTIGISKDKYLQSIINKLLEYDIYEDIIDKYLYDTLGKYEINRRKK